MRIQNNIPAMGAKRNLNKTTVSQKKTLEKLSSGYRINRSADDAAGLAISEKMRASIAALEQAENNVQDGISLVQTADGAMQEIHNMLTRMTTLAAQAANGSLSDEERKKIQEEVDQLLEEINHIKNDTEFNGIPLLQGEEGVTITPPDIKGGMPGWVSMPGGDHMDQEYVTVHEYTYVDSNGVTQTGTAKIPHEAAIIDFRHFDDDPTENLKSLLEEDTGFFSTCCTCSNHYSIRFTDDPSKAGESRSGSHYIYTINIKDVHTAEELVDAIVRGTDNGIPNGHYTELQADPTDPKKLVVFDGRANISEDELRTYDATPSDPTDPANDIPADAQWVDWRQYTQRYNTKAENGFGKFGAGVAHAAGTETGGDIVLQIGENEDSTMGIDLPNMALGKIGISNLSVRTTANAQAALSTLKNGVYYVSGERARMGSYQNRLEHTYQHLGNTVENLTKSEAQIRDADVAAEMMTYTKNNILIQSAQAMLTQANQNPQMVLQLMQ